MILAGTSVLAALSAEGVARADEPMALSVQGAMDPQTGAMTRVQSGLGGATVDFGHVANLGPQPDNGSRVDDVGGESRYVATLELIVTQHDDHSFSVRNVRPRVDAIRLPVGGPDVFAPDVGVKPQSVGGAQGPGKRPMMPTLGGGALGGGALGGPTMQRPGIDAPSGGYYIPPAGQSASRRVHAVDLYVSLAGVDSGRSSVWFLTEDQAGVSGVRGTEVRYLETLVAMSVPVGQPFRCQVVLQVPPTEWGHQSANVQFSARASGL